VLPLTYYLFLSCALLLIGVIGAVARCNIIIRFFSTGLILNAAAINFLAFARLYGDASGQIFAILIITITALEFLVALAIIAAVFSRWKNPGPGTEKELPSHLN
jgi:NADH-quinone oxidoreductase subunit K